MRRRREVSRRRGDTRRSETIGLPERRERGEVQEKDNTVAIYAGTRSFERGDIELGTRWRGERFITKRHCLHVEPVVGTHSAQIGNE